MKYHSVLLALAVTIISLITVNASPYRVCPADHGTVSAVRVSECTAVPCILKKGTDVEIEVDFVPSVGATTLTDRVKGIIAGIRLPFSTEHPDGCDGKGLTCPLKVGQKYTFKSKISISTLYPSIRVIVEWALLDETDTEVFCIQIPAQIQSSS